MARVLGRRASRKALMGATMAGIATRMAGKGAAACTEFGLPCTTNAECCDSDRHHCLWSPNFRLWGLQGGRGVVSNRPGVPQRHMQLRVDLLELRRQEGQVRGKWMQGEREDREEAQE